jgi:hypothetical protein
MADVDIQSGKPVDLVAKEKEIEKKRREDQMLKLRASMAGISRSQDGQRLIDLVKSLLIRRVEQVLMDDPEAKAYLEVLTALGFTEKLAEEAIKKLTDRRIKTK